MTARFTLLCFLLFSVSTLLSQARKANVDPVRKATYSQPAPDLLETRNVTDTLTPGAFKDVCGSTFVTYTPIDDWGFVAGTNAFGDKETAQLIRNTTNTEITITEVWAFFGYISEVGNGNIRVKLYDVDPATGRPESMRAQSNDVRVANIQYSDTLALGTAFTFPTAVSLDDPSFFLSVDFSSLYATFDTVSLYHTELGCGTGTETYVLWSDNQWFSMIEAWAGIQDFDINLSIVAVVEFDSPNAVADPYYQQGQLRLYPASPNPAGHTVQLNYELKESGPVKIELYSADGRRMRDIQLGHQHTGRYAQNIDISDLPAGPYVYSIVTATTRVASRFIVK